MTVAGSLLDHEPYREHEQIGNIPRIAQQCRDPPAHEGIFDPANRHTEQGNENFDDRRPGWNLSLHFWSQVRQAFESFKGPPAVSLWVCEAK